eukprot:3621765-Prymnesium_polylepis.1
MAALAQSGRNQVWLKCKLKSRNGRCELKRRNLRSPFRLAALAYSSWVQPATRSCAPASPHTHDTDVTQHPLPAGGSAGRLALDSHDLSWQINVHACGAISTSTNPPFSPCPSFTAPRMPISRLGANRTPWLEAARSRRIARPRFASG